MVVLVARVVQAELEVLATTVIPQGRFLALLALARREETAVVPAVRTIARQVGPAVVVVLVETARTAEARPQLVVAAVAAAMQAVRRLGVLHPLAPVLLEVMATMEPVVEPQAVAMLRQAPGVVVVVATQPLVALLVQVEQALDKLRRMSGIALMVQEVVAAVLGRSLAITVAKVLLVVTVAPTVGLVGAPVDFAAAARRRLAVVVVVSLF